MNPAKQLFDHIQHAIENKPAYVIWAFALIIAYIPYKYLGMGFEQAVIELLWLALTILVVKDMSPRVTPAIVVREEEE